MVTAVQGLAPALPDGAVRHCAVCRAIYRQDFQRCPLDGGDLVVTLHDPWIGAHLDGQYVVDALVGEGAMGRVYRAHRVGLPTRHYAIKVLLGDLASSAQMRARFGLEAHNASQLAHPNVVGVIDLGQTPGGIDFMVMPLVEGPSLGSIIQRGPLAPERVIRLATQLAAGLEHAHAHGVIHRDFKPENILVVGRGELGVARIADFGLAISTTREVRLTTTGIVCTPAYAAPEQLCGQRQPFDHRVDLYALGTTMYEMLSGGVLPFGGELDASIASKLSGEAPSVMMVAPGVPPALVALVGRLLARDPERRPRSARAVRRALAGAWAAPRRSIAAPVPAASVPAETSSGPRPHRRRKRSRARRKRTTALVSSMPSPVLVSPASSSPSADTMHPTARSERVADPPASIPARRPSSERALDELIAELRPDPRRRFHRGALQLFAVGITLGGALAWLDLHGASYVELRPALTAVAEPAAIGSRADSLETAPVPDVGTLRSLAHGAGDVLREILAAIDPRRP